MMSPTSLCQTFTNTADGYARGEGCGIVILKKLEQALKDGNNIWAIISTGCNQDGRTTTPITAPSGIQQEKLLRKTYSHYGIDPSDVQYIEAHGTGTPVGDPIEANCLGNFFWQHTKEKATCRTISIGSVKSNIGHLESAAGAAGLIKVLLMLKHGKIVSSLHIKEDGSNVNPKIDFGSFNLKIAVHLQDWKADVDGKRTACVNSFGFGGTNAHAIIQQFQVNPILDNNEAVAYPKIVCLSAADRTAFSSGLRHLSEEIMKDKYTLPGVSYTSTCRRDHLQYRLSFVASDKEKLLNQCRQVRDSGSIQHVQSVGKEKPRIIFVFCGVGTSWKTMCKELLHQYPTFEDSIRRIDHYMEKLTGWKMVDKLSRGEDVADPFFNHLAIFSCQIGLTDLLRSWDVSPECVLGQSVGEVAAAYSSGALTLEKAVTVIFHRSRILAMQTGGKMMVVRNCDIARVESEVQKYEDRVSIAVYSSPNSCTVSGQAEVIDIMKDILLKMDGVYLKELSVRCAYHSPQLNGCKTDLQENFKFLESEIDLVDDLFSVQHISTVDGKYVSPKELNTASYWTKNVCEPVQFLQAVQNAPARNRVNIFVEIGPSPVLQAHMNDIFPDIIHPCFASMNRSNEVRRLLTTVADLYNYGQDICWNRVSETLKTPEELPQYQFNRKKCLYIGEVGMCRREGYTVSFQQHPFVKAIPHESNCFKIIISPSSTPFVFDHFLADTVLVPGATYLEVGLEIGKKTTEFNVYELALSAEFNSPFTPREGQSYELDVAVFRDGLCRIQAQDRLLAEIQISKRLTENRKSLDVQVIKTRCSRKQNSDENYRCLKTYGFHYGERLRLLGKTWIGKQEALADVELPIALAHDLKATHFHPAILDAMFQMFGVLSATSESNQTTLPKGLKQLVLYSPLERSLFIYAKIVGKTASGTMLNALLLGKSGNVIAEMQGFRLETVRDKNEDENMSFTLNWKELQQGDLPNKPSDTSGVYVVVSKFMHIADKLRTSLSGLKTEYIVLEQLSQKHNTEDLRNKLTEFLSLQRTVQGMFIYLHENTLSEDVESEAVNSLVTNAFLTTREILLTVENMSKGVPIYILTEATQRIDCSAKAPNILGSELWGMVRCILWEIDIDVRLVDLQPNLSSCGNIAAAIQNLSHQPEIKEFALVDNRFFTCELLPLKANVTPKFREILWDGNGKVEVVEKSEGRVYMLASAEDTDTNNNASVTVNVTTAALHFEELYPVVTSTGEDDEIWPDLTHSSQHLRTLEVRGYLQKVRATFTDQVISCFPMTISSTVSVPEVCTARVSDFTFYEPGLLTSAVVACAIANKVPLGSLLVIAEDDATYGLAILLRHMIKTKRKSKVLPIEQLNENTSLGPRTIILLEKADSPNADTVLSQIREYQQILTLRQFLSRSTERKILDRFRHLHIDCLDTLDIFRPRDMIELVPEAVYNLKLFQKFDQQSNLELLKCIRYATGSPTEHQFTFPRESVVIPNTTAPNSSKVVVHQGNLFSSKASYVLIGGLTGLGWEILQHLASQRAGYIVCLSRRASPLSKTNDIENIYQVLCVQADITSLDSLKKAFQEIEQLLPGIPIRGVFHGGAVLDDSLLAMMEQEKVHKVLLPKVQGSWNLHVITKNLQLDFFVLHSSVVSVIGNMGQANYSAGNAFMDALANYRRAIGLPGQSIYWGALDVGISNQNSGTKQFLQQRGILTLNTKQIIQCLTHSLMADDVQHIYGSFVWEHMAKDPASQRHGQKLRKVLNKSETDSRENSMGSSAVAIDLVKFKQMSEDARLKAMLELVLKTIDEIMMSGCGDVLETTTFDSLGIDSMSAMSFVSLISERTNCRIPVIKLLSGEVSVREIATYLANNIKVSTSGDEDATEFQDLFEGQTTFMQKYILHAFLKEEKKWMYMYLIDLEFTDLDISSSSLKRILSHIIRSHPQLRTISLSEAGKIQPAVVRSDHVVPDIQEVDYNSLVENIDTDSRHLYTPLTYPTNSQYGFSSRTQVLPRSCVCWCM